MSDFDWISFIAIAEFALIVTVILALVVTAAVRLRKRDNRAAQALVKKVKQDEGDRRSHFKGMLAENFGLEGEELDKKINELIAHEQDFYEFFVTTYLNRDSGKLQSADDQLKGLLSKFANLKGKTQVIEAEPEEAAEAPENLDELGLGDVGNSDDIEKLRKKLFALAEDVALYRDTLNRVFSEYTAMFGVHVDPQVRLSAQEIMERLDSGNLGGGEDGAEEEEAEASDGAEDAAKP